MEFQQIGRMKLKNKNSLALRGFSVMSPRLAVSVPSHYKDRGQKKQTKEGDFMKKWLLTCSIDAVDVDFETVLFSEEEPGFWTCEEIAQANGCDFWTVCEL